MQSLQKKIRSKRWEEKTRRGPGLSMLCAKRPAKCQKSQKNPMHGRHRARFG
jgi:hypothetical protein